MSQPDAMYASLMARCAEPGVAGEFLKGFSGAQGYRDRYSEEYNRVCRQDNGETKPSTSVFTQDVMQQVQQAQQNIQTGAPLQDFTLPAGTVLGTNSSGAVIGGVPVQAPGPKPSETIATNSNVTFECPANDAYVFCKKKIPNASELTGIDLSTNDWQTCQRKCWEHGDGCQAWSFSKSGKCTFGTSRDKDTFADDDAWIAGPRHDPNSGGSGSYEEDVVEEEPTETSAPEKRPLWKNPIVIGGCIALLLLMLLGVAMLAVSA